MNFTQAQNYEILEDIIKNGAGIEEIFPSSPCSTARVPTSRFRSSTHSTSSTPTAL